MNHQFQISNEQEHKSSSSSSQEEKKDDSFQENVQEILQSDYQNQHLQQPPNYFTFPSATLVPKHLNNTQCPNHKEEIKKVSLKRKPKRAKQDVMEVHGSRIVRSTGRKDRHSKVSTATGPKDRRVRLSPNTAIQFYDVQDRLGYDRPSKAIDWLIKESQSAINALELTPFQVLTRKIDSTNKALNGRNVENEESQFALEQSWSADKKTKLEELAPHSSKLNATMQYSADSKIKSFRDFQTYSQGHFHSETQKQPTNDAKIQSYHDFQTYSQGHFHSETEKQPTNDAKIQSFRNFQTYSQGHFHSETEKQPTNDAKIQSFRDFQTYSQGHFHSETEKQPTNDAKIQSYRDFQTYSQGHFHSETEKQPTNDAKIQSFRDFQTYSQGHFHSETEKQPTNDAKIQSFCELRSYTQGHFHSETKNQSAQLSNFFNFQSSHQNESISFSGDHHQGFLPQNFPTVLGQNQMFNYQREPLQSSSYSNNIEFANDGLLGLCTAPIIQEAEEEQQVTLSAINATTLLHYQD